MPEKIEYHIYGYKEPLMKGAHAPWERLRISIKFKDSCLYARQYLNKRRYNRVEIIKKIYHPGRGTTQCKIVKTYKRSSPFMTFTRRRLKSLVSCLFFLI